ncbi:hypothetical protein IX327_000642 [Porphyromonas levii]|nr:hypothetical protein [Porphyromonas levii]
MIQQQIRQKFRIPLRSHELEIVRNFLLIYIGTREANMHIVELANVERAIKLGEKIQGKLFLNDQPRKYKLNLNVSEAACMVTVLDSLDESELGPLERGVRYCIYDIIMR